MRLKVSSVVIAIVLAVTGLVLPAQTEEAAAEIDVYSTPGEHLINGRRWKTDCQPYSTHITRCWTYIWMTQTELVGGKPTPRTGFHFNNLTYLAAPESLWKDNPLARDGEFVSEGRRWKTSCRDDWTGPNGCRSFIWMKWLDYRKDANGNSVYVPVEQWVFNNVVRFSSPAPRPTTPPKPTPTPTPTPTPPPPPPTGAAACGAPMPAGMAFNADGVPYAIVNPGYTPPDAFNPITVANYLKSVYRGPGTTEQKKCAMVEVGTKLVNHSVTGEYNGETVRWLPYPFAFSANPSTPLLQPGWYSGLGQAGALTALQMLAQITGDSTWQDYGQEIANSFEVPYADGGIKHYITVGGREVLWFEEYPTGDSPTTVLNGNDITLIALKQWATFAGDETSAALFEEGVQAYEHMLPLMEVPTGGGIVTSYDLVRGYPAAPLRLVRRGDGPIHQVTLNGETVSMPVVSDSAAQPNLFADPSFHTSWDVVGPSANTTVTNGTVTTRTTGTGWVGVAQLLPAGAFPQGSRVVVEWDARNDKSTTGRSAAPMTSVQAACPSGSYELAKHLTARGDWASYSVAFDAPPADCRIRVQFLPTISVVPGSTLQWRNPVIRLADPVGPALEPTYDLFVHRTPKQELKLYGDDTLVSVQAYQDGRWQPIVQLNATPWGRSVIIPERYTGRNLNYNYHEAHIRELRQLGGMSGLPVFDEYANRWVLTALNTPS